MQLGCTTATWAAVWPHPPTHSRTGHAVACTGTGRCPAQLSAQPTHAWAGVACRLAQEILKHEDRWQMKYKYWLFLVRIRSSAPQHTALACVGDAALLGKRVLTLGSLQLLPDMHMMACSWGLFRQHALPPLLSLMHPLGGDDPPLLASIPHYPTAAVAVDHCRTKTPSTSSVPGVPRARSKALVVLTS